MEFLSATRIFPSDNSGLARWVAKSTSESGVEVT
jgi:hypothetical protein